MAFEYDESGVITNGPFKGSHTTPPSRHGGEREIVWHKPTPPTITEDTSPGSRGEVWEKHPAYGMLQVNRHHGGGNVLFDSDIKHDETVVLTIFPAERKRGLGRDWIHSGRHGIVEVQMSVAQWSSAVSSFGSFGVPVTIRRTESNPNVPGLEFEPRLALSMDEAKGAAEAAFGAIQEAMAALDALDKKAPAAERKAAMSNLRQSIGQASGKVDFASKNLVEHTENVIQKARADVEAMVSKHAEKLGIDAAQIPDMLAIESDSSEHRTHYVNDGRPGGHQELGSGS